MALKILAIGEVMLELAPAGEQNGKSLLSLGCAGDTFNTVIYLSRLGVPSAYFTRLGNDPYSRNILSFMEDEGVAIQSIELVEGRTPGLYLIANQPNGERSFSFWRGQSPAREMFAAQESRVALENALQQVEAAYFSGVTLGILSDEAREYLLQKLSEFRKGGGQVIFDNNYRPQLWKSREQAQIAMDRALAVSDMALLTDDDAERLWQISSFDEMLTRCFLAGVNEVVIKRGPQPVIVALDRGDKKYAQIFQVVVPPVAQVVDTTAAGDSFNAGYLAARFAGQAAKNAAELGCRCASVVIQNRGAVVDKNIFLKSVTVD